MTDLAWLREAVATYERAGLARMWISPVWVLKAPSEEEVREAMRKWRPVAYIPDDSPSPSTGMPTDAGHAGGSDE